MGNYLSEQLLMFLRSILLGSTLGLVYDLLRALRRLGGKLWGGVLDALFCLLAVSSLFFFAMAGDGELRIFVVAGALGGAVLFFCLFSQFLRPLWDFWLNIFLSPVRLAGHLVKKSGRKGKKTFSFWKNWLTIRITLWKKKRLPAQQEGDEEMGKKPDTSPPKDTAGQKKRPNSKLTALILLALLLGVGVQLYSMYSQLQRAQEEEAIYAAQLAELQESNERLRQDIANRDNLDLIKDIARDEMGMVGERDKVFCFGKG